MNSPRFIIFITYLMFVLVVVVSEIYPEERNALLQLRDSLNSSSNLHKIWTGPPCLNNESRWAGIACSNWHVVRIVLDGIQLTGSLPPSFPQNINFLTKLSLKNNSLFGPLPNLTNLLHLEHVFLSQNRFSSSIPFNYIDLARVKKFELQENDLEGQIPPFNQSNLTVFNVSYNHLEGEIPQTRALQLFPMSSYDHNYDLCGSPLEKPCLVPSPAPEITPPFSPIIPPNPQPEEKKKKRLRVWSIVLIAAAAALVPLLVMLVFLCYYKRVQGKERAKKEQAGEGFAERKTYNLESAEGPERMVELEFFESNLQVFDLDDLLRASAEVLGKGRLGTTYKAVLESGSVVAVKRLKNMNGLSKKEFGQQMQLLGRMRHENLVQILSFYYSKEEKLVIYEFVAGANLFQLLHENRGIGRLPLDWSTRLSIIKDIAKGLNFLHLSLPSHKVPHGNLKSSNIIINQSNYHSKLTNFGFFPLLPSHKISSNLAINKAPEFSQGKKLTHKADVYSFGIVLLEIITGRIPEEVSDETTTVGDLSDWARSCVNNDWSTDVLDVEIVGAKEGHNDMLKMIEIALECADVMPERRPKMSEVLRRIQEMEEGNKEDEC